MNWIPFCWKSLECTLFSIHLNYYNLQHRSPMIYIVGWNPQYYAQCFECWFPHIRYVNHHKQCTSTCIFMRAIEKETKFDSNVATNLKYDVHSFSS